MGQTADFERGEGQGEGQSNLLDILAGSACKWYIGNMRHTKTRKRPILLLFLLTLTFAGCKVVSFWMDKLSTAVEAAEIQEEVKEEEADKTPDTPTDLRKWTHWYYDGPSGSRSRVQAAYQAKKDEVRDMFNDRNVAYPPSDLVLVGYKEEKHLEVWASSKRDEPLQRIATYVICADSGLPGPKRKQGDLQVPEGFYTINLYNNHSRFYLSMRISYPNKSDRILGHKRRPGSAIMIHGNCVSIGCLAMSDERIQEIWVMTEQFRKKRRRAVQIYMFPGRDLDSLLEGGTWERHHKFWKNLKDGLTRFEKTRRPLRYRINRKGEYVFRD